MRSVRVVKEKRGRRGYLALKVLHCADLAPVIRRSKVVSELINFLNLFPVWCDDSNIFYYQKKKKMHSVGIEPTTTYCHLTSQK